MEDNTTLFDIMDIIITIFLVLAMVPLMLVTVEGLSGSYADFGTMQDKSLVQVGTELFQGEENRFNKFAIPSMFCVEQAKDEILHVKVQHGGTVLNYLAPTSSNGGHTVTFAQEILKSPSFKALPVGDIFYIKDLTDGAGNKIGIVFYTK